MKTVTVLGEKNRKNRIDRKVENYSKVELSKRIKLYLNGSSDISMYEAQKCFELFDQKLMTESESLIYWNKKGYGLYKKIPTRKKLRLLYKIQKLVDVKFIG